MVPVQLKSLRNFYALIEKKTFLITASPQSLNLQKTGLKILLCVSIFLIHTDASMNLDIYFYQDKSNSFSFGSTTQELSYDYFTFNNIKKEENLNPFFLKICKKLLPYFLTCLLACFLVCLLSCLLASLLTYLLTYLLM